MDRTPVRQVISARVLINTARARGVDLSYQRADRAARGLKILQQHGTASGFRLEDFKRLTPNLRRAVRWVCEVLNEIKGVNLAPYLRELDRLDNLDALDAVTRWRQDRVPMIPPNRSPQISERAYIEANGY